MATEENKPKYKIGEIVLWDKGYSDKYEIGIISSYKDDKVWGILYNVNWFDDERTVYTYPPVSIQKMKENYLKKIRAKI